MAKPKSKATRTRPTKTIELGDRVKSRLHSCVGIVSGEHDFLGGMRQLSVTDQKAKAGEHARMLDIDDLVIVKKRAVVPSPFIDSKLKIGDRVKDSASQFQGILTGRHRYVYGCLQFSVTAENGAGAKTKEENLVRAFDANRLDLILQAAVTAKNHHASPPGGPEEHPPAVVR